MKKSLQIVCVLIGMLTAPAFGAPIGWYELNAVWRDGSFAGKFYYDNGGAPAITQVDGILKDIAQTTAITTVWTQEIELPQTGIFVGNTGGADGELHNAGFYLNLTDLGAGLGIDLRADNSLHDWSSEFAFYTPELLGASPLLTYTLAALAPQPGTVSEPGGLPLLALGGACAWALRRRTPKR